MKDPTAAVRKVLMQHLQTTLAPTFPTLKVFDAWPTPGRALPPFAIAVLVAGQPDLEGWPAAIHEVTPGVSPNGTVVYSTGRATIPLQLDCWALSPAQRDALADAVWSALRKPNVTTLNGPVVPRLSMEAELVLPSADLAGALCDFEFQPGSPVEDGSSAQSGEWRMTWTGEARVRLQTSEQVPLIKELVVSIETNGATAETITITE